MEDILRFDPSAFTVRTCTLDGRTITYRAFENIPYCTNPVDPIQKLNIFVPECYYHEQTLHGYTLHTAPIFAPNTVGGYLPGSADVPGLNHKGMINATFEALDHGYVVMCAGIRGRTSGKVSDEFFVGGKAVETTGGSGQLVGKAPAFIVDMKAAIRYLRYNKGRIPGDTEKIITSGTSAGGALSALAGASGNHPDYQQALAEIGAANERDDIFAANCYCPIHNLEHADAAYEWMFCGVNDYHKIRFRRVNGKVEKSVQDGVLTEDQIIVSQELNKLFPSYVNSLYLRNPNGEPLTLDATGNGSFKDYVKSFVMQSAQSELDTHHAREHWHYLVMEGSEVEKQNYLSIQNGTVTSLDWDGFIHAITRMKPAPAFDALDLNSPENDEFGTENISAKHFTEYAHKHSKVHGELADPQIIKMMNPLSYIGCADTAPHWRIRHGVYDRDTSLAIPVILATILENKGFQVDFSLPWGLPHSGDYDLNALFVWVDHLCGH